MRTDSIAIQLEKMLDDYEEEIRRTAEDEMKEVAKETAKILKTTSPRGQGKRHYATGWTTKKDGKDIIVYNRTKPTLTHLLERGHAKVNGGRVAGRAHIKPAQEWAENEIVRRIESKL